MIKQLAAVLLLSTVLVAQEKQQQPPSPPAGQTIYRLEYTVTEMEGAKRLQARNYSLQVIDRSDARMRVGNRIPITTGNEQVQYMDIGVNIDARATMIDAHTVRVRTNIEVNSLASTESSRRPIIRNFNNMVETSIPLDKPIMLTSQDEPGTSTTFQVSLTARIVK